jgi:hypothetical protein
MGELGYHTVQIYTYLEVCTRRLHNTMRPLFSTNPMWPHAVYHGLPLYACIRVIQSLSVHWSSMGIQFVKQFIDRVF